MQHNTTPIGSDFFERLWEESWTYVKTVVDVVREPILILSKDLRVLVANKSFYQTFLVEPRETEKKIVYELGNGQWDIPSLKKLLEDILPKRTFFNGFEVAHEFPAIGRKVMILNARQIYYRGDDTSELFPPIILLAMEDITEMIAAARRLAEHTGSFEAKVMEQTKEMRGQITLLQKDIISLKKTKKR